MFLLDDKISMPVHRSSIPDGLSIKDHLLGKVVQAVVVDNKVYVDQSDGMAPLGIVIKCYGNPDGRDEGVAEILLVRHYLETTHFDIHANYSVNASLFVSKGLLTTTRTNLHNPAVGMVIEPPSALNPTLKMIWL